MKGLGGSISTDAFDEFLFRPNPEVISGVEPIYKLQTFYYELVVASKSEFARRRRNSVFAPCQPRAPCCVGREAWGQPTEMSQPFISRRQSVKGKQ